MRDLAIIITIFNEISLLSDALKKRYVNILPAEQLIKSTIKAFKFLRECSCTYETISSKEFPQIVLKTM